MKCRLPPYAALVLAALGAGGTDTVSANPRPVGTWGKVGCLENPKLTSRPEIPKPGLYKNYRIDAEGRGGNIVKVSQARETEVIKNS